jgi:8-oxo-dGTP pyrophosphatase MutT (NUDIX family)
LFGGGLDRGEDPLQALRRELREELELDFAEAQFFARIDFDLGGLWLPRYFRNYYVVTITRAVEMVAPDTYLSPPELAETYQCRSRDGTIHQVRLRRHLRLNRDFPQFAAPLAKKGQLRQGEVAGTPWIAVSQQHLLDEVFATLEKDLRAITRRQATR